MVEGKLLGGAAWHIAGVGRHSDSGRTAPERLAAADRADLPGDWDLRSAAALDRASSTHFYIFCLVSFIFYSFHYTGKLNAFDWSVYWSNVVAWLLQPALFLHFVLTFPERRHMVRKHPWLLAALYVPGLSLLGVHVFTLRLVQANEFRRWNLERLWWSYLALYFAASAAVLWYSYVKAGTPT